MAVRDKHSHYHKNVAHLTHIDVYRTLERFGVTDPTLQHAIKKLLVAGGRGSKDIDKDIQEAIDSLQRFQEMRIEDAREFVFGSATLEADEFSQEAFKRALSDIPNPQAPRPDRLTKKQAVRKMPEETKRQLASRKAAKRPARRGR